MIRNPLCLIAMLTVCAPTLTCAQNRIQYDKSAPELRAFRTDKPGGESSAGGVRVRSLNLPVLDFKTSPVAGVGGFETGGGARRGVPIYDPKSQDTYAIRHVYDGVTILITADLRIAHTDADSASTTGSDETTSTTASAVTIEAAAPGDELMARAVVMKFGIPYNIDIECSQRRAAICMSKSEIRKIISKLGLVSIPKEG